jgi:Ca2+-binding RTX toxin-like protein
MAVYQFSALSDGQAIDFVPTADVLRFDQSVIAAADLRFTAVGGDTRIEVVSGSFAGKDVLLLDTTPLQISETNVTFADGSKLLIGNQRSSTTDDNSANSLVGTSGRDHLAGLGGNDTLSGLAGDDVMHGGAGNDTFALGAAYGNDVIDGGAGNDRVDFGSDVASDLVIDLAAGTISGGGVDGFGSATLTSVERVIAGAFDDRVIGDSADNNIDGRRGNDSVSGAAGDDTLLGRDGNDRLEGGSGNDTLTGGAGQDSFVFADAPSAANVDRITDFVSGPDQLVLDDGAFAAIGAAGNFSSGDARFFAGAGATSGRDATDRIVYDTSTGNLYYDADGSGSGAAQLIATLQGAPTLVATDIAVADDADIVGTEENDTLTGTDGAERIEGRGGDDLIDGRGGDDTLDGGLGFDILSFQSAGSAVVVDMRTGTANGGSVGGSGNDVFFDIEQITGTAFNDHVTSQDVVGFNDIRAGDLYGAQGDDTLIGGAADDLLSGDGAMHFSHEGVGNGNDEMRGGGGDDLFSINFRLAGGSYGNDTIDGGDGTDTIVMIGMAPLSALSINLATGVMSGGGANGSGTATLVSIEDVFLEEGNTSDVIIGNSSANRLTGSDGYDTIRGGAGDDDISMTAVSHTAELPAHAELFGEDGNDEVGRLGGQGSVLISGGSGNDTVVGGFAFSTDRFLFAEAPGSANADLILRFEAGSGDDTIELDNSVFTAIGEPGRFASGDERFAAGAGFTSGRDASDRIVYDTSTGNLYYDADGSGGGSAQLIATLENGPVDIPNLLATDIVVVGSAAGPTPIQGTAGDDSLTGTAGDDVLEGLAGNDTLRGLAGNDTLDAGTGGDELFGGAGNDTYIVDGPGDTVIENAGEGTDTVQSSATRTLEANVENLTLAGSAAINGTGNTLDNVITGNGAANVLDGGTGIDSMIGGTGNDTYVVTAGDILVDSGGTDTVISSVSWDLSVGFEDLTLTGTDPISALGSGESNTIIGNDAGNRIEGFGNGDGIFPVGNDTIFGGGGNDFIEADRGSDLLFGDSGDDVIVGSDGLDTINGGSGNDEIFGDSPDDEFDEAVWHDLIHGDSGNDNIRGNRGDDQVFGDSGNDTVIGGDGNDDLFGGDEHDLLDGSAGNDGVDGGAGDDTLLGGADIDTLSGGLGNDTLDGEGADDLLTGGAGADSFRWQATLAPTGVDLITDFQGGIDEIVLVPTGFGPPRSDFIANDPRFHAAAGATSGHDASDRVIYDTSTGNLYYDADGSGEAAATLVLTLQGAPTVVATDIAVFTNEPVDTSQPEPIRGTEGNDTLTGTAGDDVLEGLGGNDRLIGLAGDDTLRGGTGNDTMAMAADYGNDVIDGGEGIDLVDFGADVASDLTIDLAAGTISGGGEGGAGSATVTNVERMVAGAFNDQVVGSAAADYIDGRRGNDSVSGAGGNDTLLGRDGEDRLEGGSGNDTLTGGAGQDSFVFADAPGAGNADRITDFASGTDQLALDNAAFTAIGGTGDFSSTDGRFWAAAGATSGHDASDRIVYDTSTGSLYYDADGSGSGEAQLIATFQENPALAATDVTVI